MPIVLGHIIGAGMIAYSVGGFFLNTPAKQFKKILAASFHTHELYHKDDKIIIKKVKPTEYGYEASILLPSGLTVSDFRKDLKGIEEDTYSRIRFKHIKGRECFLAFGRKPLDSRVDYDPKTDLGEGLPIPFLTHYGPHTVDLRDESSCHILAGGATRMGKTVFLRLIICHLMHVTKGKIEIKIFSNKITDFYMFKKIPQITQAKTNAEVMEELDAIIKLGNGRAALIERKGDIVDLKQFRKKYPDEPMDPILVVIDEYGRYADDEKIQEKVIYIAETFGYLDIHLVISTQRPDVTTVLKPRIKANILTKLAFTTSDENNSKLIVGTPDAAHLEGIKGRAVLLDGLTTEVHVPYIDEQTAENMMKKYRSVQDDNGTGQNDNPSIEEIQGIEPGPNRDDDLLGQCKTPCDRESNHEKTVKGFFSDTDS